MALSSSALAAPGFVSAAIDGETGGRFELAGRVLSSRTSADPPRAARSVPIARLHADRSVDLLPEVDAADPDLLLVDIATPEEAALAPEAPPSADASSSGLGGAVTGVPRAAALARAAAPPVHDRLARPGGHLVVLLLASRPASAIDALSYAMTLLTGAALPTSIERRRVDRPVKIYAIFLSLIGAVLIAIVYAFITDAIIRSRLLQTLGGGRVPGGIRDHVIVAGLGAIGYRVALGVQARGVPGRRRRVPGRRSLRGRDPGRRASRSSSATPATARSSRRSGWPAPGRSCARPPTTWSTCRPPSTAGPSARTCASSSGCSTRSSPCGSSAGSGSASPARCRSSPRRPSPRPRRARRSSRPSRSAIGGWPCSPGCACRPGRPSRASLAWSSTGPAPAGCWRSPTRARTSPAGTCPADEVLDADEEVVLVATRAGLAELLHLAALPAGAAAGPSPTCRPRPSRRRRACPSTRWPRSAPSGTAWARASARSSGSSRRRSEDGGRRWIRPPEESRP